MRSFAPTCTGPVLAQGVQTLLLGEEWAAGWKPFLLTALQDGSEHVARGQLWRWQHTVPFLRSTLHLEHRYPQYTPLSFVYYLNNTR